jgi:very-short-patch-repair endonuclease
MTDAEKRLWKCLRNAGLGFKFHRQKPIGQFIPDFVCLEKKVIVEADGSQQLGSEYDAERDAWLEGQGFRVLRFWNNEILENTEGVLERIREVLLE